MGAGLPCGDEALRAEHHVASERLVEVPHGRITCNRHEDRMGLRGPKAAHHSTSEEYRFPGLGGLSVKPVGRLCGDDLDESQAESPWRCRDEGKLVNSLHAVANVGVAQRGAVICGPLQGRRSLVQWHTPTLDALQPPANECAVTPDAVAVSIVCSRHPRCHRYHRSRRNPNEESTHNDCLFKT